MAYYEADEAIAQAAMAVSRKFDAGSISICGRSLRLLADTGIWLILRLVIYQSLRTVNYCIQCMERCLTHSFDLCLRAFHRCMAVSCTEAIKARMRNENVLDQC